jgi:hypothetical protein
MLSWGSFCWAGGPTEEVLLNIIDAIPDSMVNGTPMVELMETHEVELFIPIEYYEDERQEIIS